MKKNSVIRLFALCLALCVLSACDVRAVDKGSGRETATPSPVPPGSPSRVAPAAVEASGAKDPGGEAPVAESTGTWNRYVVVLPSVEGQLVVRRARFDEAAKTFPPRIEDLPFVFQNGRFVDPAVESGALYRYEWGVADNTGFKALGRKDVAVPLDLEMSGDIHPGNDAGKKLFAARAFGTLIFLPGTVITTDGARWEIRASRVVFNDTKIRSFAPNAAAPAGQNGRDGGEIYLKAAHAEGVVDFELRGENGGAGLQGPAPGPELKGEPGFAGVKAEIRKGEFLRTPDTCVKPPTAGTRGGTGRKGYQGLRGGKGGDSAVLTIEVADRDRLQPRASSPAGIGGVGGPGGAGGEGGTGGPAGYAGPCPPATNGEKGPMGETGQPGEQGPPGFVQRICYVDGSAAPVCSR